jgi:hypothetical protein
MGHLITVQNLLILLGGREAVHFQRDVLRKASSKNPIPFILRPVDKVSLATYVIAEMPADVPEGIRDRIEELKALAKESAGSELHRVGVIYTLLIWLFTPEEQADTWVDISDIAPELAKLGRLSPEDVQPAEVMEKYEAQRLEWQAGTGGEGFILETPRTLEEGRKMLEKVAEQGEGLSGCGCSHFQEFMEMADAFDKGEIKALPIAISPFASPDIGGENGTAIKNEYARLWAQVFDSQYTMLVLTLYHAMVTERGDGSAASARRRLIKVAFDSMRRIIEQLSDLLAELPLDQSTNLRAGPSYGLDPMSMPPIPDGTLWNRHRVLLKTLSDLYQKIREHADFSQFPDHDTALTNLENADRKVRETVDAHSTPPPS